MADFVLTRQILKELAEIEKSVSGRDLTNLEQALADIVKNPYLPGRVPCFYDPSFPSYLYCSGSLLIHYQVPGTKKVEFLTLFWPRI